MSSGEEPQGKLPALQQAVLAMKEMRTQLDGLEARAKEPLAVTGMACRFPGNAATPEAFWKILSGGIDAVKEVPPERWDSDSYYDPDPDAPEKMVTRHGGFLADIDRFDPKFFGISIREACAMDPQHRLLLEVSWEALERAGEARAGLRGSRTGVFIGITAQEYIHLLLRSGAVDAFALSGNPLSAASGRISYTLGLQGPCVSIDTACSSALVAVHQACRSLRAGECDLALAGGVNLTLLPQGAQLLSRARMLSPEGKCRAFDAAGNGFVRGEGCGIFVLKRLSDAEKRRDHICALILASAVNHDGSSNGFTAPNGKSQELLIRSAVEGAGVDPLKIGYVEAHGTGTRLGDPIEIGALSAALCEGRPPDRPLFVGSVKTNLGHLESAAGVAGMAKAILCIEQGEIPPNLHFEKPNPHIPWGRCGIRIPENNMHWPVDKERRLAGVSSFGATGTNAHVILAGPPAVENRRESRPSELFVLSAGGEDALRRLMAEYRRLVAEARNMCLADLCYSASAGRFHFKRRLAAVVSSAEMLAEILASDIDCPADSDVMKGTSGGGNSHHPAFHFSGDGISEEAVRQLSRDFPAFRRSLENGRERLSRVDISTSGPLARHVLSALALFETWTSWGIRPRFVCGEGLGRWAAAIASGMVEREAALLAASGLTDPGSLSISHPRIPLVDPGNGRLINLERLESHLRRDPSDSGGPEEGEPCEVFRDCRIVLSFGPRSGGAMPRAELLFCTGPAGNPKGVLTRMLEALGTLYVEGAEIDWEAVYRGRSVGSIPLPTYPFQRIRCWAGEAGEAETPEKSPEGLPEGHSRAAFTKNATFSGSGGEKSSLKRIFAMQMETASRTLERVVACQLAFLEENHECACPEAVKQDSNSSPPPASEDSSTSSAQVEQKVPEAVDWSILPLGAATEEELEEETEHLSKRIRSQPKTAPLRKIAAEFQNRDQGDRRPCRRFLVARTCEDALNALEKSGGKPTELFSAFEVWNAPSLVFMLPGVGDHYINMSAGLYEAFPEYRRLLDRCAEILLAETGEDIRTVLFDASKKGRPSPAEGGIDLRAMIAGRRSVEDEATSRLNRIHHTHPLLFAVEFSLAGLWESFGVRPAAMVGFSLGEFVAAALAGVFTLEDALRLVSGRAGLMQNLPEGRMLAIPLPEDAVRTRLTAGVEIAVVCTPETTVVTGPKEAVAVFEERLRDEGVLYRSLQVSRAFHSTAMKPAEAPFREMIADIRLHVPRIPLCSNLTGDWISEDQATDPEYWVRHAGARILFSDGLERLLEEPERVFLEVGPGQALGSFVFQHPRTESAGRVEVLATLRSVNDAREDAAFLLTTLGRLWLLGLDVRWPSLKT